jgi:hypothetical protein
MLRLKKSTNFLDLRNGLLTKGSIDLNLLPPTFTVRVDSTTWHSFPQHFFQAQRLSTELEIRVFPSTFADFVFHRIWAVRSELDQISFTADVEMFGPQWHIAFGPNISDGGLHA